MTCVAQISTSAESFCIARMPPVVDGILMIVGSPAIFRIASASRMIPS